MAMLTQRYFFNANSKLNKTTNVILKCFLCYRTLWDPFMYPLANTSVQIREAAGTIFSLYSLKTFLILGGEKEKKGVEQETFASAIRKEKYAS